MKLGKRKILLAACLCLIAVSTTSVFAQKGVRDLITVDEYGGSSQTPSNPPVLPFAIALEPFSGLTTLVYRLPFTAAEGDVFAYEGTNTSVYSDLMRFENGTNLFIFSDLDDTNHAPADVGIPAARNGVPLLILQENIIQEGKAAEVDFTAAAGGPGYTGFDIQYKLLSEGLVPEPGSLSLVCLGGGLVFVLGQRRRRRRR
jgi:hypothetical protein